MYGCENWILSEGDLELLEAFQGELAKRILKLPISISPIYCSCDSFGLALSESKAVGEEVGLSEESG